MEHNKLLLIIIFLSFLSISKIFPQDSTLSQPEIKNYIGFLEKVNGKLSEKDLMNQPLDSIKKIASLYYQACDKDCIGIKRYFRSIKGLQGIIYTVLTKRLDTRVINLMDINYLLELRINSLITVQHHSLSANITYPRVEISATVIEALKGTNKFKPGDHITFVYNCHDRMTSYNFQEGETVFAAVDATDDKDIVTNFLSTGRHDGTRLDNRSYGRYPIENGILIDNNNAWGYGKSVPWEEFKKKLTQDINEIYQGDR
jgi:hypothetical protein